MSTSINNELEPTLLLAGPHSALEEDQRGAVESWQGLISDRKTALRSLASDSLRKRVAGAQFMHQFADEFEADGDWAAQEGDYYSAVSAFVDAADAAYDARDATRLLPLMHKATHAFEQAFPGSDIRQTYASIDEYRAWVEEKPYGSFFDDPDPLHWTTEMRLQLAHEHPGNAVAWGLKAMGELRHKCYAKAWQSALTAITLHSLYWHAGARSGAFTVLFECVHSKQLDTNDMVRDLGGLYNRLHFDDPTTAHYYFLLVLLTERSRGKTYMGARRLSRHFDRKGYGDADGRTRLFGMKLQTLSELVDQKQDMGFYDLSTHLSPRAGMRDVWTAA